MFSDWKRSASGGRLPELNGKIPSFANMRQGMDPGYTEYGAILSSTFFIGPQIELAETAGPSTALASLRSGRDDNIEFNEINSTFNSTNFRADASGYRAAFPAALGRGSASRWDRTSAS